MPTKRRQVSSALTVIGSSSCALLALSNLAQPVTSERFA